MASTVSIRYSGDLHTDAIHNQSGAEISTDAPTDYGGKGEGFSPTDLATSSLASCALTIMGLKAASLGIEFNDVRAEVQKTMATNPRRISAISIDFHINHDYPQDVRTKLEAAAHACPIAHSLSADLEQTFTFHYA